MFNTDGTPQALKLKAMSRTYAHAFQGTPQTMYFSTKSGAFETKYIVDDTITANTEVYVNNPIWYPQGMKTTISHAKSGKQMEGVFIKSPMENYLDFTFFDIQDYAKNTAQILITPILQETVGDVVSSDNSINANYNFEDTGLNGACPIKVTYENGIAKNIQVELITRNKTVAKEFGRTIGSN